MNQVSYQLEDTVSGMIWVKFKFCHKIIQCLKQIPGYKYNDKKWYIPTEHMDLLSEKVRKECETEDISISKKRKNMDDREDEIQKNHGYDFVDPYHVYTDAINVTNYDDHLVIHLPISREAYSALRNYPHLVIKPQTNNFTWVIEGEDNMFAFEECCTRYRFRVLNFRGYKSIFQLSRNTRRKNSTESSTASDGPIGYSTDEHETLV